jgi:hypothetical protein
MRVIQNDVLAFRCSGKLKKQLNEIAVSSDLHVSQLVRMACVEFVNRSSETGKNARQAMQSVID